MHIRYRFDSRFVKFDFQCIWCRRIKIGRSLQMAVQAAEDLRRTSTLEESVGRPK